MRYIRKVFLILILILSVQFAYGNDYKKGKMLLEQGKVQKSKELFYRFCKENPNSYLTPFALHEYGKLESNFNGMIRQFKKIEERFPNYPNLDKVYNQLALLYFMLNDYNKSKFYFQKIVVYFLKSPIRKNAVYFISKINFLQENYDEAIKWLNKYDDDKFTLLKGQIYLSMKDYSKSVLYFNQLLHKSDVDQAKVLYFLIKTYSNMGKKEKALLKWRFLLQQYPKSIWTLSVKKLYQFSDSKYKNSKSSSNKYKQNDLDNTKATYRLFIQLGVFSSEANAKKVYKKAIALNIICYIKKEKRKNRYYYRIFAGPYNTRNEVLSDRDKLNSNGFKTIILKGK